MKLNLSIEIVETTKNMLDEFLKWYGDDIEELTDKVHGAFYEWFDSNFDRFVECNLVGVGE